MVADFSTKLSAIATLLILNWSDWMLIEDKLGACASEGWSEELELGGLGWLLDRDTSSLSWKPTEATLHRTAARRAAASRLDDLWKTQDVEDEDEDEDEDEEDEDEEENEIEGGEE